MFDEKMVKPRLVRKRRSGIERIAQFIETFFCKATKDINAIHYSTFDAVTSMLSSENLIYSTTSKIKLLVKKI